MKITPELAEIVGILIGDGYIYKKENKYQIGFVGSPKTDVELFEHLKKLIFKEWKKEVKYKVRERGLRMVFRSKEAINILVNELQIPYRRIKGKTIKIPAEIAKNWKLAKQTIRGIMDTDGSIFVSKKSGIEKYPAIEITTTSQELAIQLRQILLKQNFRITNIRKSFSKTSKDPAYRVCLYGKQNIKKWLKEISFSNKYKEKRAKLYIQ